MSDPKQWVGLGFVATIENAPGQVLTEIDGITMVAAQVAWGTAAAKPLKMKAYLDDLSDWDLLPVGWGWCDAEDPSGARNEGFAHARIASDLGLGHFIANMEEPYDAHGDVNSPKFHLPDDYCKAFRSILPDIHFAVTTTPRWASNHAALRDAGAVTMPQAFPLENGKGVAESVEFCMGWGWTASGIRPLCQVYETNGQVPPAGPFLSESEEFGVGLVPYILEQALGGQGRELLRALVPAITRQPMSIPLPPTNGDDMEKIGPQHGIVAAYNRMKALDPVGCNPSFDPANYNALPLDQLKAWDKKCRTDLILAADHDEMAD